MEDQQPVYKKSRLEQSVGGGAGTMVNISLGGKEGGASEGPIDPAPPSSFLCCVVCGLTPSSPPLLGCELAHIICVLCRAVGGALLSCPSCGSQDISHRLTVADELLGREIEAQNATRQMLSRENRGSGVDSQKVQAAQEKVSNNSQVGWGEGEAPGQQIGCPYRSAGCLTLLNKLDIQPHKEVCSYRPVKCPKALFSTSCQYKCPLVKMQQHGREEHGLHKGVTCLQPGLISSKMFDRGPDVTCCDDNTNAKFQPLELTHGGDLFYCYFERIAGRRLWFFFVRMFGGEAAASEYSASIMVGRAGLGRDEWETAGLRFSGAVAHYGLKREEARSGGMVLAVADEVLKACKEDNVLFRVWFKVKKEGILKN